MKYLKIFTNFLEVTAGLTDGALGRLFRAMMRYAQDGVIPAFKGKEAVAWAVARQHIDREAEAYERKTKHLMRGSVPVTGKDGPVSEQEKEKEKENEKEKEKEKESLSSCPRPQGPQREAEREIRPSLEEVISFSQERGLDTDVEYFFNYYEANGWHIGNQPIRDWKAALIAWARKTSTRPPAARRLTARELFEQTIELQRIKEAKEV